MLSLLESEAEMFYSAIVATIEHAVAVGAVFANRDLVVLYAPGAATIVATRAHQSPSLHKGA